MRSVKAGRLSLSALAAVLTATTSTGIAEAAPPATICGQVITTDWVLKNDVGPCPGNGVIVGADNITLNLGGHRIIGNFDHGASGEFAGVRLPFRTGVTITGKKGVGTIEGFEAGVVVNGGSGNAVQHLTVQDNVGPLASMEPELGDGIILFSSSDNQLRANRLLRNGYFDGIGVLGVGSNRNVVEQNSVLDTLGQLEAPVAGVGIITNPVISGFTEGAQIFDNTILSNTVARSYGQGISTSSSARSIIRSNLVEGNGTSDPLLIGNGIGVRTNMLAPLSTNALVEDNTVRGNGRGIEITASDNQIVNNRITGSVHRVGYGLRLGLTPTSGNLVSGNVIDGNAGHGIDVRRGNANVMVDNAVTNNAWAGIAMLPGANGSVMRNEVHGNGGSGIHLFFATGSQIRDNDAADNLVNPTNPTFSRADLVDQFPNCDANTWFGNIWGSGGFNQPCVTTGGHAASSVAAVGVEADTVSAQEILAAGDEGSSRGSSGAHRRRPKD